jgi:hypothetical protein
MIKTNEPHKVLNKSDYEPVAIRKSALIGCFVPANAVSSGQHCVATVDKVMESLASRCDITHPVLDHLQDEWVLCW